MNRKPVLIIAAIVALGGIGGGIAVAGQGGDEKEDGVEEPSLTGSAAGKASAAALKATGGGTVLEVERADSGGAAYEVEVRRSDGGVVEVQLSEAFAVTDQVGGDDD